MKINFLTIKLILTSLHLWLKNIIWILLRKLYFISPLFPSRIKLYYVNDIGDIDFNKYLILRNIDAYLIFNNLHIDVTNIIKWFFIINREHCVTELKRYIKGHIQNDFIYLVIRHDHGKITINMNKYTCTGANIKFFLLTP